MLEGALDEGIRPDLHFFRDSNGNEIDLLIREGGRIPPVEIKSARTFSPAFIKRLEWFRALGVDGLTPGVLTPLPRPLPSGSVNPSRRFPMDKERQLRIALAVDAVTTSAMGLLVLWIHGPFIGNFKSIFMAMNVELPKVIQLYVNFADLLCGPLGMLAFMGLLPATAGLVWWSTRKGTDPALALSAFSSAKAVAIILVVFACTVMLTPMCKIVNSVP